MIIISFLNVIIVEGDSVYLTIISNSIQYITGKFHKTRKTNGKNIDESWNNDAYIIRMNNYFVL